MPKEKKGDLPDPYAAPDSKPYFTLWCSKADMDVQRNLLLNFMAEYKDAPLDYLFLEWLKRRAPDILGEDSDDDSGEG